MFLFFLKGNSYTFRGENSDIIVFAFLELKKCQLLKERKGKQFCFLLEYCYFILAEVPNYCSSVATSLQSVCLIISAVFAYLLLVHTNSQNLLAQPRFTCPKIDILSSPELCSGWAIVITFHLCVRPCVRLSTFSNNFSSEAAEPILLKIHMEPP